MSLVYLVMVLLLLEYYGFVMLTGAARVKGGVDAPAVTGDPLFERTLRVQQNTLEQLIVVLPTMWIFALTVSEQWAAILGAAFFVGRILYCISYRKEPGKRAAGFLLGMLATAGLLIGSLVGAIQQVL